MKPVSRTHFHAPNWHSYDGKPAEVALATAVRKVGEFQPDAEPAPGPRTQTQKTLWNSTCAEKMSWCLRCHLYWENSSSAWSSTARSWSLCVLVSQLKNNLPWQEFPKRKYLRLWGSHVQHCWGHGSTWYGGNLVPERAAGLEKKLLMARNKTGPMTQKFSYSTSFPLSQSKMGSPRLLPKGENPQNQEVCTQVPDYILIWKRGGNYKRGNYGDPEFRIRVINK